MRKSRALWAFAVTVLILSPQSSSALSFEFEGTVDSLTVSENFTGTVPFSAVPGVTVASGQLSFDPTVPGVSTGPGRTDFAQVGESLLLTVPGFDLTLPVEYANTSVEATITRFGITAVSEGPEAQALGVDRVEVLFGLLGDPGLLAEGVLPTDLSHTIWDIRQQVLLRGWTQTGPSTLALSWLMSVEPFTVTVPEPGTASLVALGLASLGLRRRSRATKSRPTQTGVTLLG
jgi:hypothetical protein